VRITTPGDIELAARAVEAGQLVVVPTGRWYMICCDAANADACSRIFAAKRRPVDKSLLFVAKSIEDARQLFDLDRDAEALVTAFWPGDLALLLPWKNPADGERHPAVGTPVALVGCDPGPLGEMAKLSAAPIAATSANLSGTSGPGPSISLAEVREFAKAAGADIVGDDGSRSVSSPNIRCGPSAPTAPRTRSPSVSAAGS
jgi:L-threonylcarbamoyladenylate synthase